MAETITDAALEQISRAVAAQTGLQFFRERWDDLKRAIKGAYSDAGFDHPVSFVRWLLDSLAEEDRIDVLVNHLTVGETHFFRHDKQFEVFRDKLLPRLIESRRKSGRRLRIWSAGCSTGEEPYSIAITLLKRIPDLADWNISILGTDINRNFLDKASEGVYTQWSFRDVPEEIKKSYFNVNGRGSRIIPEVKRMVTFSRLNFMKEDYPNCLNGTEGADVIFCRNVLMYFTPERQSQVLDRLSRCLVDGGWLIVSPAEASVVLHSDLQNGDLPWCYRISEEESRAG